jgi:hypothetical protein
MKNIISTACRAVVFVFIIFICACRSQRQAVSTPVRSCFSVISTMPDSIYCVPNIDSSYYLCQDKKVFKSHAIYPQRVNRIRIIQCDNGDVIFNEEIPGGTARWADVHDAEIFCPSGIPRNSLVTTYRFNVKSQKKIYLDSNKE